MNPLVQLAIDGVRFAVGLARQLIEKLSETEEQRELHNAALEKEIDGLRGEVKGAAAKTRELASKL